MTWDYGPERTEAIRALEELIRKARLRLDAIGATADAEETAFHLRDAADIEYGELRRETEVMEEALRRLGEGDPGDDERVMRDALETLRRDIER